MVSPCPLPSSQTNIYTKLNLIDYCDFRFKDNEDVSKLPEYGERIQMETSEVSRKWILVIDDAQIR